MLYCDNIIFIRNFIQYTQGCQIHLPHWFTFLSEHLLVKYKTKIKKNHKSLILLDTKSVAEGGMKK